MSDCGGNASPEMEEDLAFVVGRLDEAEVILERRDEAVLLVSAGHAHRHRRLRVVLTILADLKLHLATQTRTVTLDALIEQKCASLGDFRKTDFVTNYVYTRIILINIISLYYSTVIYAIYVCGSRRIDNLFECQVEKSI